MVVGLRVFEVVVVGMVALLVGVSVLGVMLVGVRVLVVGVMALEVVMNAMLVLVVGGMFLGVIQIIGVKILVIGALLNYSLLPPPSYAAISVQGRRKWAFRGVVAAAGVLSNESQGCPSWSQPEQSEVQQVGRLHQRTQMRRLQGQDHHKEFNGSWQNRKSKISRTAVTSSGGEEGLES